MARTGMSAWWVPLLALAACATPEPPAPPLTPQAQQEAGDRAIAGILPPDARIGPRRGWRPLRVDNPEVANAFVDAGTMTQEGDARRGWIVMNFREGMPMPETGGRALSVAIVGDYRCAARQWRPLENIWYRERNAERMEWRQPSRQPTWREVERDTSIDVFLAGICGAPPPAATRPRGTPR